MDPHIYQPELLRKADIAWRQYNDAKRAGNTVLASRWHSLAKALYAEWDAAAIARDQLTQ